MLSPKARQFLAKSHMGALTTFRRDGAAQMSVVTCGPYQDGVAFTTTEGRAKLANLRRDPRCTLLVSQTWWPYLVVEGRARILDAKTTGAEELRIALREVYQAAAGKEHPNWPEYDEAMVKDRRVAVIVAPERVYGTAA